MRLLRGEPGHVELSKLRDEGDLETLAGYISDTRYSRRLRRKAVVYVASFRPGGGKAETGSGITDPAIVPILAPLLEHDVDRPVRRAAAAGLRKTGDVTAVQPLLRALKDDDKATRIHAIMGLGDLRSRAAVKPLSEMLTDRVFAKTAATALVEIGDASAVPALTHAASSTQSRRQRNIFEQAASDLRRKSSEALPG